MKLEIYQTNRAVKPHTSWSSLSDMYNYIEENKQIETNCKKIKETCDKSFKSFLPAMMPMGNVGDKTRKKENCTPTGLVMIDIDGTELLDKSQIAAYFLTSANIEILKKNHVRLVHITPSGRGLRLLVCCHYDGMEATIERVNAELGLNEIGQVDPACKDLSRLSYLVPLSYIIFENELFADVPETSIAAMQKYQYVGAVEKGKNSQSTIAEVEENDLQYKDFEYNGYRVADIVKKYIETTGGNPPEGTRHTFYNQMIVLFRNLCNNDAKIVHAVLPSFDLPSAERWSQCVSLCSSNRSIRIDSKLYFWLREHNILAERNKVMQGETEENEENKPKLQIPPLPPIFRQYVAAAPENFKVPTIIALLPILGTLTSHLRSTYFDDSEQSTEFISLLFAPPSSGKSFIKRLSVLLKNLKDRDELANAREEIYASQERKKGANDKGQEQPQVSVRIVKPLISVPELLTKMRNNCGHHMYIEAEELDTFAKGNKGAGGDKSDLWRVTWDNGYYGQYYKSVNTFKGEVQMFMNLLFTSTQDQIDRFFKNVEDGLVTRFSVCPIEGQEYAKFVPWKKLSKKDQILIDNILTRLEAKNYKTPLKFDRSELVEIKEDDFDKLVPWQYEFQPFEYVDLSYIYKPLLGWLEEQRKIAACSLNPARDVFRRRAAVKGFRLALLCHALYNKVGKKEIETITNFVVWFCGVDLENSLYQFGSKYNELQNSAAKVNIAHADIYQKIASPFSMNDLRLLIQKNFLKTPARKVLSLWKRNGFVKKTGEDTFEKIEKK